MIFRAIAVTIALAAPAAAQTLEPGPLTPTAWDDYSLAVDLFNEGERLRAGCAFYRGQFRARLMLTVRPNTPPTEGTALFAALQENVGRPINEWLGGDRDDWLAAMTCARDWVLANDDPDLPRDTYPDEHALVLSGLNQLIEGLPPAAVLQAQRTANGLPNR